MEIRLGQQLQVKSLNRRGTECIVGICFTRSKVGQSIFGKRHNVPRAAVRARRKIHRATDKNEICHATRSALFFNRIDAARNRVV